MYIPGSHLNIHKLFVLIIKLYKFGRLRLKSCINAAQFAGNKTRRSQENQLYILNTACQMSLHLASINFILAFDQSGYCIISLKHKTNQTNSYILHFIS